MKAPRVLRAGGTLSSLGVYSGKLSIPHEPFAAGLGNHKIITTLCPGDKERMQRLMELVRRGRLDLQPLLTHRFSLDRITEAYKLFGERRDNVNGHHTCEVLTGSERLRFVEAHLLVKT